MVKIDKTSRRTSSSSTTTLSSIVTKIFYFILAACIAVRVAHILRKIQTNRVTIATAKLSKEALLQQQKQPPQLSQQEGQSTSTNPIVHLENTATQDESQNNNDGNHHDDCPYMKVSQLSRDERRPHKGSRHMITPPEGGLLHLVCCHTTQGPFNALVHERWAPLGAKRFLEMVHSGYFNAGVPLFRCIKNFICQFGLNNDPHLTGEFKITIPDDPNWLPEGPDHKKNSHGVARFAHGYLAYAGGGPNTRDNQLIVSLANVESLAGGSPWEVPWGELVGQHSFETWAKVYTGYDDKGPEQGVLVREGVTKSLKKQFPKLDYINSCRVVDQQIQVVGQGFE